MRDLDRKLKDIARNEQINTPEGFGERIENLAKSLSSKNIKPSFKTRMLRPSFAAAVIAATLLAIGGVVYASGIIASLSIGWDGQTLRTNYEEAQPQYPSYDFIPESADEYDFRQIRTAGEVRRICSLDKNSIFHDTYNSGIIVEANTVDELRTLLSNGKASEIKLPSYIPEGYQLDSLLVLSYLSPDYIDPNIQPDSIKTSENGNQMQIFTLPEEYKNHIMQYQLSLKNSEGSILDIACWLEENYDTESFDISPKGTINNPKVSGFNKAIYISDSSEDSGKIVNHSYLAAQRRIDAIPFYSIDKLGYGNGSLKPSKPVTNSFKNVRYQVTVNNNVGINENELIKIIDSLNT